MFFIEIQEKFLYLLIFKQNQRFFYLYASSLFYKIKEKYIKIIIGTIDRDLSLLKF